MLRRECGTERRYLRTSFEENVGIESRYLRTRFEENVVLKEDISGRVLKRIY